jgi:uncharacterized membrane protein YfcA
MVGSHKKFIPNDKPRSWVLAILSVLIGMGGGVLGFVGAYWSIPSLYYVGLLIFAVCAAVSIPAIILFTIRFMLGHYRNLTNAPWNQQQW